MKGVTPALGKTCLGLQVLLDDGPGPQESFFYLKDIRKIHSIFCHILKVLIIRILQLRQNMDLKNRISCC